MSKNSWVRHATDRYLGFKKFRRKELHKEIAPGIWTKNVWLLILSNGFLTFRSPGETGKEKQEIKEITISKNQCTKQLLPVVIIIKPARWWSWCTRSCSDYIIWLNILKFHVNITPTLLLFSFLKWENWVSGILSNLPKMTVREHAFNSMKVLYISLHITISPQERHTKRRKGTRNCQKEH